jgi:pimeloyl-ACP methyl ester carboxylesterase
MGKHFLLIHGAWHGGWCWEGVVSELNKPGHSAEAPTMPGHGPSEDKSKIRFDDYVNRVADVLRKQREQVVLVGHSSAGFLLQASAPKVPDKISHLVFLNAFVLPDGKSQFDLVPPEASGGMIAAAKASSDNSVPVIEEFVRNALMAGESKEMQDALLNRLTPQPLALFTTPVSTSDFMKLRIPRSVVFCKDDVSLPPGAYLGMAQGLGDFKLVEVAGGHETLFTNPPVVAKGLLQAVNA